MSIVQRRERRVTEVGGLDVPQVGALVVEIDGDGPVLEQDVDARAGSAPV